MHAHVLHGCMPLQLCVHCPLHARCGYIAAVVLLLQVDAIRAGTGLVLQCRQARRYDALVMEASAKLLKVVPEVSGHARYATVWHNQQWDHVPCLASVWQCDHAGQLRQGTVLEVVASSSSGSWPALKCCCQASNTMHARTACLLGQGAIAGTSQAQFVSCHKHS